MLNYVFESKVPVPSLSEWRFPVSISQRDLNISLFRFSAEVGCRCLLCQGELSSVTCTAKTVQLDQGGDSLSKPTEVLPGE